MTFDVQHVLGAIQKTMSTTRSEYHLTLGQAASLADSAIGIVKYEDGGFPGKERSYRGYYSDLAFEDGDTAPSAKAFAEQCKAAIGSEYEGYKGGDFKMADSTPLWRSGYGTASGIAIISAVIRDNDLILITKQVD